MYPFLCCKHAQMPVFLDSAPVKAYRQKIKPPVHAGYIALAILGGLLFFASGLVFVQGTPGEFFACIGGSIGLWIAAGIIKALSDIRWHLSQMH